VSHHRTQSKANFKIRQPKPKFLHTIDEKPKKFLSVFKQREEEEKIILSFLPPL